MNDNDFKKLFEKLYFAPTEKEVEEIVLLYPKIFRQENWHPLGENYSNFGVIENQQSSPIAALIEKITNSIDAILMKKCYEADVDPKNPTAPRSMEEAIEKYFPTEYENWDLPTHRKIQAENIQIVADGPRMNTSIIIYDNGEGQLPEDFENTFLSLLRGNKNEIHFVQGKYNMGGSGAIVFCGKRSYELIASKRLIKQGNLASQWFVNIL